MKQVVHPQVISIKMTLYRVAKNSKVVKSLIRLLQKMVRM